MTAAITWLVIWLVLGLIGSWLLAAGTFLTFVVGVTDEKVGWMGVGVLCGIAGTVWTILWIVHVILQVVSIVNIAQGA